MLIHAWNVPKIDHLHQIVNAKLGSMKQKNKFAKVCNYFLIIDIIECTDNCLTCN